MLHPDTIRDLATMLRIVHHIPGRVRLKLEATSGLGAALDDAKRFVQAAGRAAGIKSVDLNALARSCIVEYDPRLISPAAWQDLIAGTRSEAADALAGTLAAAGRT